MVRGANAVWAELFLPPYFPLHPSDVSVHRGGYFAVDVTQPPVDNTGQAMQAFFARVQEHLDPEFSENMSGEG